MKTHNFADLQRIIGFMYAGRRVDIQAFDFPFSTIACAAAASSTQTLQLLANADFLLTSIVSLGAVTDSKIQIVDSASNERFFDDAVPSACVVDDGGTNYRALAWPRLLSGNATLQFTITGMTGGVAALKWALRGVLVRDY